MKFKKVMSCITAAVCCAGLAVYMPYLGNEAYAAELVKNDFEVTYEGWHGNADTVSLLAEESLGYNGTRGMLVSDRTSPLDGACSSKGFYLSGGVDYTYSVQVYSKTAEKFKMSLICIDEETGEEIETLLASKEVKAGEWTKISADYTAPENSYEFKLTIRTDSVNDFSFDDVLITTEDVKQQNVAYAVDASNAGLKNVFGKYFRVGNILNGGTIKNSAITANVLKNYSSIECENETKADAILRQNGSTNTNITVSLDNCAAIMDFCVKNKIGLRGHAFVWHSQTPSWFFKDNFQNGGNWVSSSIMDQRLESYIKNTFAAIEKQYPTLDLYAYDVCNECVSDDSSRTTNGKDGAREAGDNNVTGGTSAWVSVYGNNSFVEKAFTYARKYAPEGCDLYYNDYNEYWDHKRDCIYNMCKNLYNKNLLDGVGMQSHVPANATGFAGTDSYIEAMDKYLSIGCDVQVTELDISLESGKYSLQDQANKYKAIFQHAIDVNKNGKYNGKVTAVCIWGPNDANSWLKEGSDALLFDKQNNPKLAYNTLMGMLPQSEWVDDYQGGTPSGPIEPNEYGWYFQNGFEEDACGWQPRGGTTVEPSADEHYTQWGSKSLKVTGRTSAWNGAICTLNTRAFEAGKAYSFSVHVKHNTGDAAVKYMLKLQYKDASGETQYDEIASGTAPNDEWIQLANTSYKLPDGATDMQIYVESEDTTNDFYIDEAIGAQDGVHIQGEGVPEILTVVLGDVNCDGKINIFDLAEAKDGFVNGFAKNEFKKAADVDQSGVVDIEDIKLLQKYIAHIITEFPVAEKVVNKAEMEKAFASVNLSTSYKKDGENNVLWTQRFGADPGFMVYKDRLYVYTTNDAVEYRNDGSIQSNTYNSGTINCFSSSDLVNWTDHGAIPVAGRNSRTTNGAAKWASYAWAPDACWKNINGKDKFFLYFADSAGGIGVLEADSPEGPYRDPIGKALITKSTPGFGDVEWLFDPAALVDDDGTGYIYVGGGVPNGKAADPGTARAVKLNPDMVSLSGEYARLNPPYLFEDSSIIKEGDTYYYSYCTNWSTGGNPYGFGNAEIGVMSSKNPLGPFTFEGIALKNPASYQLDGGGNNHHSIVKFKNKFYMLYHSRHQSRAMNIQATDSNGNADLGGNYRSCHLDECTFANGKFSATGTMKGVSAVDTLNPYQKVQAETMYNQSKGIVVNGLCDTTVSAGKGEWIKVTAAKFDKGSSSITVRASSKNGAIIKICDGGANGTAIGYVEIPAGGTMSELTFPVDSVSGTKDITFVFSDQADIDWWSFS